MAAALISALMLQWPGALSAMTQVALPGSVHQDSTLLREGPLLLASGLTGGLRFDAPGPTRCLVLRGDGRGSYCRDGRGPIDLN